MTKLRLGTRKSALAQAQAQWVSESLRASNPDLQIDFVSMTTSGDLQTQRPSELLSGGLKAMFTKEIEEALLDNRIDVAVHSLKDMATELPASLEIAVVPQREDPRDVWIGQDGKSFASVKPGAKIATGAVRRQAQLRHYRPDLELVAIRGNVDTRLRKLTEGPWNGLILALAGLRRLGREKAATEILTEDIMLPAVGQGALGLEIRQKDTAVLKLLQKLDHPPSHQAAIAERAFLKALGGSCQTPIAAYAQVQGSKLVITGLVVAPQGNPYLRASLEGSTTDAESLGQQLAHTLIQMGADKILS